MPGGTATLLTALTAVAGGVAASSAAKTPKPPEPAPIPPPVSDQNGQTSLQQKRAAHSRALNYEDTVLGGAQTGLPSGTLVGPGG